MRTFDGEGTGQWYTRSDNEEQRQPDSYCVTSRLPGKREAAAGEGVTMNGCVQHWLRIPEDGDPLKQLRSECIDLSVRFNDSLGFPWMPHQTTAPATSRVSFRRIASAKSANVAHVTANAPGPPITSSA